MNRTHALYPVTIALSLLALPGCGVAAMVENSTRAVEGTTATLRATAPVLEDSNRTLHGVQKSMEKLASLQDPMERVAGLERSMAKLAELKEPMDGLQQSMGEIAALKRSLAELKELGVGMKRIAELKSSMEGVAALDKNMGRVAELKEPMEQVAVLQRPLEEVSKLSPPMVQMTQMGTSASRRIDLVLFGVLLWGLVTFLGVYFGVKAGSRRLVERERAASKPEVDAPREREVKAIPRRPSLAPVALPAVDAQN